MYWTTLGRALAPCKIPEIREMQICIDIPVLNIWKLISTGLFVSLFGFMYISSSFFHFLPVFSTFFRKKLEEIPFFQFLPFFPEETYFFRKFPNPVIALNLQILELKKLFESDTRLPRYWMSKSRKSTTLATTFFLFSLFFLNPVANMAATHVCIK